MYRHCHYNPFSRSISLRTWDADGVRIDTEEPFSPYLYTENIKSTDGLSIFKTPLRKLVFGNSLERKKFVEKSTNPRIFHNLSPEQQFLIDRYSEEYDKPDFSKFELKTFYLDIETYTKKYDQLHPVRARKNGKEQLTTVNRIHNFVDFEIYDEEVADWVQQRTCCYLQQTFPDPINASRPVNLITIYDSISEEVHTWGLHEEYKSKQSNYYYYRCADELELFEKFMAYWKKDYCDIITGWNCIEQNERVWLEDRITPIREVKSGQSLALGGSILRFARTGQKDVYEVTTYMGSVVRASVDHKFPVCIVPNGKYKCNYRLLNDTEVVKSVSEIQELQKHNKVFVKRLVHNNKNPDLTYGEFFSCVQNSMRRYIVSEDDNTVQLDMTVNRAAKNKVIINKHEPISVDILQLMGFIFTYGHYSKTECVFRVTSKYQSLIDYYTTIYNTEHNCNLKLSTRCETKFKGRDCLAFAKQFARNNKIGVLMFLIYNDMYEKELHTELMSRMSHNQFAGFYSGLNDGDDGCIGTSGLTLCNYDCKEQRCLEVLQDVLSWNGVISSLSTKCRTLLISNYSINKQFIDKLNIQHPTGSVKLSSMKFVDKQNSPSRHMRWMLGDGEYIVQLRPVVNTGIKEEMCDIETETHLFSCNGTLTHNCTSYDIPYIINRGKKLLGDDFIKQLSPVNRIHSREVPNAFGQDVVEWTISGMSCLDYMVVYKNYSKGDRESYSLGYISEYELGETKNTVNATSLSSLADEAWEQFVEYNIQDVMLVKKLEDNLKYLNIVRLVAYKGLANLQSALGKITVITGAVALQARKQGMIIPTFKRDLHLEREEFVGGFVREPERGLQEAVVSFDVNSLYPNTMVTLNISPETKLGKVVAGNINIPEDKITLRLVNGKIHQTSSDKLKKLLKAENIALSKAGVMFTQKYRGVLPGFIVGTYIERVRVKDRMHELKQRRVKLKKTLKRLT